MLSSELSGSAVARASTGRTQTGSSDHRAVLSDLRVTPAAIPTTVALSSRMLTVGDTVTVTYQSPYGADTGTVALTGPSSVSHEVTGGSGAFDVETGDLSAGEYDAVLAAEGGDVVARNSLHLRPEDAEVELHHRRTDVRRGDTRHRPLDRRAGQPMGLDRGLPCRCRRPGEGRLPALGLHRWP